MRTAMDTANCEISTEEPIAPNDSDAAKVLTCDGWCNGADHVTHIGSKGYVYCAACAYKRTNDRNTSETCRRLRGWELAVLQTGKPLRSHKPISKAEHERLTRDSA